jgi:hypothetical protein
MTVRIPPVLVLAVLCLPAACSAADKIDVTGTYEVVGANPSDGEYKGKAEITKDGDLFEIKWTIGDNESYEGVGILQGDIFAVSFKTGTTHGVVSYKVSIEKLDGKWGQADKSGKVFMETLTKK